MSRTPWNDDDHLRDALAELTDTRHAAPDLSRSIMGRLGYMRVSSEVARRKLIVKWANRAGMLAVCAIAVTLGWRVFEASPHVRRAAETTVPQAITHDARQQTQRIDSMLQTIRQIASPRFTPTLGRQFAPDRSGVGGGQRSIMPQPAPGSMDAPFSADTLGQGGSSRAEPLAPPEAPQSPVEPFEPQHDRIDQSRGQQLRDDLNRDRFSSVRWA